MIIQKPSFATFQDVVQFLSRYVKYWRLAGICAVLGTALALGYFVYGKPAYYSKSLVDYSYLDLPLKSEISDLRGNTRWDNIHVQVASSLQSSWLAERTAIRLGLVKNVSEIDSIWGRYISKIKISGSVANQLAIEIWVYEPRLAKLWPEAMLAEYHDYLTESRMKHRDNLVKGFTKEMDRIRENLGAEAERDRRFEAEKGVLENFVNNNKLEQLPTEMLTYRSQLDAMAEMEDFMAKTAPNTSEKLALLKKYRAMPLPVGTIVRRNAQADPFMSKISSPDVVPGPGSGIAAQGGSGIRTTEGGASPMVGPANANQTTIVVPTTGTSSDVWESIDTELVSKQRELEQLSTRLLPGHEKMRELQKSIDELKFALDVEWKKQYDIFQLEKAHLNQKLVALQGQLPEYRKLVADYDDYRRDFRLDTGGRMAWEQAYLAMKTRLTAMEYTGPEVQVQFDFKGFVEVRDQVPVAPNKKKLMTYGLMLSLGLGIGIPVVVERLRFTTSFVAETEKVSQYPACGIVPLLMNLNRKALLSGEEDDNSHKYAHVKESFRIIRCALPVYAKSDNKRQVIMVTSSRPGDGKTTVTTLLAKSFADAGEKTVIVDGDLRRGAIHRIFSLNKGSGLADALLGQGDLKGTIQKTEVASLDLISRGTDDQLAYDCLEGTAMAAVIEELRKHYDKIIIDTPPLLGIADSLMIQKHADGVLLVIRADQTPQRDIATASEVLHQNGIIVYGFVLNGVDLRKFENQYYYGFYNSRYYEPTYYHIQREQLEIKS